MQRLNKQKINGSFTKHLSTEPEPQNWEHVKNKMVETTVNNYTRQEVQKA